MLSHDRATYHKKCWTQKKILFLLFMAQVFRRRGKYWLRFLWHYDKDGIFTRRNHWTCISHYIYLVVNTPKWDYIIRKSIQTHITYNDSLLKYIQISESTPFRTRFHILFHWAWIVLLVKSTRVTRLNGESKINLKETSRTPIWCKILWGW